MLTGAARSDLCTYETSDWDTLRRQPVHVHRVNKSKNEISSEERDEASGCTVCQEDQAEIRIEGIAPLKVCRVLRDRVERALRKAKAEGFALESVVGYRVSKSRGALNGAGERTQFSHHSFGVAVDVNSSRNGLYDSCVRWGPECRLIRGGEYRPGESGTVARESEIHRAFQAEGFKWGGEIAGKQKDFMHFSPDGY